MQIVMKKTISIWLLFCFLTTIFHFHPHTHNYEITSKQIINKQNDANHYFSNGCEKCLTKNSKSELQFPAEEIFNNFLTILISKIYPVMILMDILMMLQDLFLKTRFF